jgi:hypothetical protein
MGGIVALPDGRLWSVSSAFFSWVVDRLAEGLEDPGLAARIDEIAEVNLGWLGLADYDADERDQLIAGLRGLPRIAEERLTPSADKTAMLSRLRELAGWLDEAPT